MPELARPPHRPNPASRPPTVEAFLLGQIDFARCLELQRRLAFESDSRADGQIALLLCEHPPIITIGRGGARSDVRLRNVLLAGRQIEIFRVDRDGGTMLHLPGQLAIYPIVPLDWYGWSVKEFLDRFQAGLLAALAQLGIAGHTLDHRHGIWGQSGQLVSMGVEVREGISRYGAQLHVLPPAHLFQYLETDAISHSPIGSLHAEQPRPVLMPTVRSRVVRSVSEAFGCPIYHCYTGHPLLAECNGDRYFTSRAS